MQISLPSRQHEIALMCHLNLPFRPRYAFPFFRLPAFFAFTVLSSFVEMCVCVDFQDLSACLATFVVFAQTSHIFLCGACFALPFFIVASAMRISIFTQVHLCLLKK